MIRDEINVNSIPGNAGTGLGAPVIAPTFIAPTAPSPMSSYAPAVSPVGGFGTGFGNNSFLETIIALSLIGRNGLGGIGGYGAAPGLVTDGVGATVTAQNVADLRKDVADVGKDVVGVNTTVHALGNEMHVAMAQAATVQAGEFRNLDNQICETDKNAIRAQYESKIANLQSTNEITNKVDTSTNVIQNQLFGISTTLASEFCNTNHLIERGNSDLALQAERNTNLLSMQMERGFCKIENDAKDALIAELRDQRECSRRRDDLNTYAVINSQQTSTLTNLFDSQLQKQTSQIVQFTGPNGSSTAIPTVTNNQVS